MKTGIVILNYNDYETSKEMIQNIKNYKSLDYIVIVDNKSSDGSYEKLKKYENKKIKVIQTKENKGYAHGNNYGIKYLVDNYNVDNIIISNPDIIVTEETIQKLILDLKENKNISLIAPVIKQLNEELRGWKLPTFLDDFLSNINYIQRFSKKRMLYSNEHYENELSKVDVVSGCFFMIRALDFKDINYFDEGTFLYYEENIIGSKLKKINKESYIDNSISVIHNLSISVDKSINKLKKYKILKNSQRYYEKKYNNLNVFGLIILKVGYYVSYFVAYIIYIFKKIFSR